RQALQLGHYLNSTCPRHRDFQVQPIYRHDVGSGSGPGPLGWEHDGMSRHFVVVAGITILNATTPVSASAQICDGALSWLYQALASSNRDASNEIQQDKARRRLPTKPTTGPQRSHKPVSLTGRRLSPQHSDPRGFQFRTPATARRLKAGGKGSVVSAISRVAEESIRRQSLRATPKAPLQQMISFAGVDPEQMSSTRFVTRCCEDQRRRLRPHLGPASGSGDVRSAGPWGAIHR